jgi:dihydrodipicolinate synthase/N-acetylneuraminate lyase
MALSADYSLARASHAALIRHLEAGGIRTIMYGGNANFYNIPISRYAATCETLIEIASDDTWIIPGIGPDYGRMIDQIPMLRSLQFPTAMPLPAASHFTADGLATALRSVSDMLGKPLMFYVRQDNYLPASLLGRLVGDGVVGSIKYAVVRSDPANDPYLEDLLSVIDSRRIISGIGERPVVVHFEKFGLRSFTSGSVAVAPAVSNQIRLALARQDYATARRLREFFLPLEDMRDRYGPARVVHDAVTLAAIADMGPFMPLQSNLTAGEAADVEPVAKALFAKNAALEHV